MGKVAFMRMCLGTQSCPTLATPWTVPPQASLSIEFSRQEYLRILPISSPGDLPAPGIKPVSPALAGGDFTPSATWEAHLYVYIIFILNW